MSAEAWTPQRRSVVKARIDKQAERARQKLGATAVITVAFFTDGRHMHVLDGGTAPNGDFAQAYRHLISVHQIVRESGGKDVSLS